MKYLKKLSAKMDHYYRNNALAYPFLLLSLGAGISTGFALHFLVGGIVALGGLSIFVASANLHVSDEEVE